MLLCPRADPGDEPAAPTAVNSTQSGRQTASYSTLGCRACVPGVALAGPVGGVSPRPLLLCPLCQDAGGAPQGSEKNSGPSSLGRHGESLQKHQFCLQGDVKGRQLGQVQTHPSGARDAGQDPVCVPVEGQPCGGRLHEEVCVGQHVP